jgi:hypothetical protein
MDLRFVKPALKSLDTASFDNDTWRSLLECFSRMYIKLCSGIDPYTTPIADIVARYKGPNIELEGLKYCQMAVYACKNSVLMLSTSHTCAAIRDHIHTIKKSRKLVRNIARAIDIDKYDLNDVPLARYFEYIRDYILEMVDLKPRPNKFRPYFDILCLYLVMCRVAGYDYHTSPVWPSIHETIAEMHPYAKATNIILYEFGWMARP